MQRKPADIIADPYVAGPAAMFLVDGNNNIVVPAGSSSPIAAGQNLIGYVEDIEQQGYIALTSPPGTTNAGSDTILTFSQQVNRVIIQNNTNANVNFDFDQAASAGSFLVGPGGLIVYPKKCTTFHLFTATAQNINGNSGNNIVVRGAM